MKYSRGRRHIQDPTKVTTLSDTKFHGATCQFFSLTPPLLKELSDGEACSCCGYIKSLLRCKPGETSLRDTSEKKVGISLINDSYLVQHASREQHNSLTSCGALCTALRLWVIL